MGFLHLQVSTFLDCDESLCSWPFLPMRGLLRMWRFLSGPCSTGEAAVRRCYISQCSPENRINRIHVYPIDIYLCVCVRERERDLLIYCFTDLLIMRLQWLASLKSVGRPPGQKLMQNFYIAVWRQNYVFRKPRSFLLSPSTDWMRPTHIIEGNLLYLKSTDLKC